jgi:nicotinate-nucleotide adenylyltransferase
MKIAVYSGSFNPVHNGHTLLAKHLIDNNLADEVWFVVSPCNPLKEQKELIDEHLRLEMLIHAIANETRFKASDVEFTMSIPSYTIDTLQRLNQLFPEKEFCLIIGSDNALVFDKWKNYKEILTIYEVLVYPRKGYNFSEVADIYPQMKLLNSPFYDISSSQIRKALKQKKDVTKWLHPNVLKFIIENKLYES